MNTLKISLLHAEILHARTRENRALIVSMASNAADNGARIIIAPEMCLSGYIFNNRDSIAPYVETAEGPAAQTFSRLAKEKAVFLAAGFAENDPATGIYYNTAFVWGPDGKELVRYRKINAESRWACPGPASQDNVFDTPWGKCALLICSDTYHSLPARTAALKGARLLLIPANWPPSGKFPENVWRFRALENGVWLAAANRTGNEPEFDCRECRSYVFTPEGKELSSHKSERSSFLDAEIPLSPDGGMDLSSRREEILASRRPWLWHRLYANLAFFRDITGGLGLPAPGPTEIALAPPGKGAHPADALASRAGNLKSGMLVALPLFDWEEAAISRLEALAKEKDVTIITAEEDEDKDRTHIVIRPDGTDLVPLSDDRPSPPLHAGTLAVEPVRMRDLLHPEAAVSAAKRGADLLLAAERELSPDDVFTVGMRTIDQAACLACASDGAALGLIPDGHAPGKLFNVEGGGWLTVTLDSSDTRVKRFQDRVDYQEILKEGGKGPWDD
ncbi:MAG: carbon-nitrogen hydrolase family protein [Deltaproteobacteria bacterium]|jgi:predicted amidohydrolase|nr:carbon-nitrogen hydrolase family protein [Deltaproteobacteria bacterium]